LSLSERGDEECFDGLSTNGKEEERFALGEALLFFFLGSVHPEFIEGLLK
jgi:hypothetical protein